MAPMTPNQGTVVEAVRTEGDARQPAPAPGACDGGDSQDVAGAVVESVPVSEGAAPGVGVPAVQGMVLRYGHTIYRMPLDRSQRRMVRDTYRRDRQQHRYQRHEAHRNAVDLAIWSISQRVPGWVELRPTRDAPEYMRRAS